VLTCRACGRLVNPARPDPEHEVVFILNTPAGRGPFPHLALHSPWPAARKEGR
jgi:hypothetical protein